VLKFCFDYDCVDNKGFEVEQEDDAAALLCWFVVP
jgi:hypothetical protein